jgi:hypothetical protein
MSLTTCLPNVNCGVTDPDLDEDALLGLMKQRAQAEKLRDLKPSEWECSERVLKRFLTNSSHYLEGAMASWTEWVKWRHCTCRLRVLLNTCFRYTIL